MIRKYKICNNYNGEKLKLKKDFQGNSPPGLGAKSNASLMQMILEART